jgi:membrane protein DedA with SNARE-associated domain
MPLKVFVISAGVLGTPPGEFIGVMLAARILRYFGEAWLGVKLGGGAATFLKTHVWYFVAGAVVLFVVLYGFIRWRERARSAA